jgi:transposase
LLQSPDRLGFIISEAIMEEPQSASHADIRFRAIDRNQVIQQSPEQLLPCDHSARLIVAFVAGLDFSALFQLIKAREGHVGAPPYDPRLLFSLWLFATVEGVPSARQLEELCGRDLPYLWICGGPAPSYHTLSTFYATHGDFLDASFVDILAALTQRGLITPKAITIDGRKVTAHASKESFHRAPTLLRHRQEAQERVDTLRRLRAEGAATASKQAAAQQRAAEQRQQQLDAALQSVRQRQAERAVSGRSEPDEARASATDPDARKMKRSHGGFEPSFNVQTATDVSSGLIVAVTVEEQASDNGLLRPMVERAEANTGTQVEQALVDSGYSDAQDVETLERRGTQVYMPPKNERKEKQQGKDPYQPKRRDTPELAQWRQRLGTAAGQEVYRQRAPVAEGVHAQQSNRGWKRFRLRGRLKAGTEALWQALAHNVCVLMAKQWLGTRGILRTQPA